MAAERLGGWLTDGTLSFFFLVSFLSFSMWKFFPLDEVNRPVGSPPQRALDLLVCSGPDGGKTYQGPRSLPGRAWTGCLPPRCFTRAPGQRREAPLQVLLATKDTDGPATQRRQVGSSKNGKTTVGKKTHEGQGSHSSHQNTLGPFSQGERLELFQDCSVQLAMTRPFLCVHL